MSNNLLNSSKHYWDRWRTMDGCFRVRLKRRCLQNLLTCTLSENILRLVPKGMHNYDKFIPKQALISWCSQLDVQVVDTRDIIYEPLRGAWIVLEPGQTWGEQCNY
ncbi:hypothetical protein BCR37DRAFT_82186 [Protomyces lactucae-debilis]|uniref:Uncharacterized protein n=1 Tax=Protomyces lactucae-debilis TaxID=2754530 RepID=A0A1Y2F9C5_PROLT|nr:uncharacterized protein BCR37DRAFT_82186 [Protomyces lactucae-debilis]ORY79936.1 hypothetical protein BCR37DRAFT_82186 [Protomyces lactucae-debilis]